MSDAGITYETLSRISRFNPVRKLAVELFLKGNEEDIDSKVLDGLYEEVKVYDLHDLEVHSVLLAGGGAVLTEDELAGMLQHRRNLESMYRNLVQEGYDDFKYVLGGIPTLDIKNNDCLLFGHDRYWTGAYWLLFYLRYNRPMQEDKALYDSGCAVFGRFLLNRLKCMSAFTRQAEFTTADSSFIRLLLEAYRSAGNETLSIDAEAVGTQNGCRGLKFFHELKIGQGLHSLYDVWMHDNSCIRYLCAETREQMRAEILKLLALTDDYTISLEYMNTAAKNAVQAVGLQRNVAAAQEIMQQAVCLLDGYGISRPEFGRIQNVILRKCGEVLA